MQQHGIARFQPRVDLHHPVYCGQPAHGRGRGVLIRNTVRQLEQRRGGHHAFGRIGPQRATIVGNAIPGRNRGHALAHGQHLARALHSDAAGRLDRVVAGAEIGVGKVAAHRMMADPHFARTRIADGDLFERQDFGSANLVESDGLGHRLVLPLLVLGGLMAAFSLAVFTFRDILFAIDDRQHAGGSE